MDSVLGLITGNYATEELQVLTAERGIASLPFGSRYRLVDFPISNMVNSGLTTVGLVTPYKYRSIIDHVGSGSDYGLDRKHGGLHILPGSVFGVRGNLNSRFLLRDIRRNMVYIKRSPMPYVLITASNSIYKMDYTELVKAHIDSGAGITMAYCVNNENNPNVKGLVLENNVVKGITNGTKVGDNAFMDCYIINRGLLIRIMDWYASVDYYDTIDLIAGDIEKLQVNAWKFDGYAKSIFTVESYYNTSMDLLKYEVNKELFVDGAPILTKIQDWSPARYGLEADVQNSLIPAGCTVEGTVENSILFRGVKIKKGAVVKNSIIMQSCVIEEGACVENAIIDRNNVIGKGTVIKGTPDVLFIKEKAGL